MANGYTLHKSDPTKYASQAINVPQGGNNDTDTSLTFIGPSSPSFGIAVNEDFLYLLENFANATPPSNPTEGQLWYDTSNGTLTSKQLRVYDNTGYAPVNGVWQRALTPGTLVLDGAVKPGDIWVDTSAGQLFITLDALTWTLVGPTYSSVLKSGSYAEQITDTAGGNHRVIKNYIDDNVIEIIASERFTPNPPILGFASGLAPGINLSSTYNSTLNATAKYASALTLANGTSVTGNSLVRTDQDSTINATLNVQQINIGSSAGGGIAPWTMKQVSGNSTFVNPKPAGRFSFQVTTNPSTGIPILTETLVIDGNTPGVGIGLKAGSTPKSSLDVNGIVNVSNTLYVNTTTLAINSSGTISTKNLVVSSTATVNNLNVNGFTTVVGNSNVTGNVTVNGILTATTVISNFQGTLQGAASSLTNASFWGITGQVFAQLYNNNLVTPFSGQSGQFTFISSLTNAAISAQPEVISSNLVNTTTYLLISNENQLNKISYNNLFAGFIQSLIPTGTIIPFAGITPPSGWLFCDGAYVSASEYAGLFSVIGYTYGKGSGAEPPMAVPDLRSKALIGFDDMNNYSINSTIGTAGTRAGLSNNLTPNPTLASLGDAAVVDGSIEVTTGSTSVLYYQAINYIIKT
jgi:microcystin-dependent protein